MNIENLSPAQSKALEAGRTNNAIIGNSLVKRGAMTELTGVEREIANARFVCSEEYIRSVVLPAANATEQTVDASDLIETVNVEEEIRFAEAMEREENETETSEEFEIETMKLAEQADADRYTVTDEDDEVSPSCGNTSTAFPASGTPVRYPTDPEDLPAVLDAMVPPVVVRDPKETRYAHIDRWTDNNLDVKRGILEGRLRRRTLLKSDRMQAERHLRAVVEEIERRPKV